MVCSSAGQGTMSDPASFTDYYLRQIGVVTPLSEAGETQSDHSKSIPETVSEKVNLEDLARQAAGCTACALSRKRTQVVFGTGNPHADILFIGEAPGHDEDIKGEPFVGRAGKLLDGLLAALGFDRQSVYIMNVVKCRPPENRNPKPEEVQACSQWFDPQWDAIAPKIVCLLGRVAAQRVLQTEEPLTALRGKWHEYRGVPVWVTYHPAYLLRSPSQKSRVWADLRLLYRRYQSLMT
ncbi:MAG: uracil-DNA glycosylase [Mariprofundaceae bacterium]|nr:uracil-DNA glycosylase [Mariprofundaceae bacterium]